MMGYDLLVIGNSRAGRQAALAAGRMGKSVALIQQGTLAERSDCDQIDQALDVVVPGFRFARRAGNISLRELRQDMDDAARRAEQFELELLQRHTVAQFRGMAAFVSAHEVRVTRLQGSPLHLTAERTILACGSRPEHSLRIPASISERVFVPETLWQCNSIPAEWLVIGASRHGLQSARLLAQGGAHVTLIDGSREISSVGLDHKIGAGWIECEAGEDVIGLEAYRHRGVRAVLESGRRVTAEAVLVATGRKGDTNGLKLDKVGLKVDENGRVWGNFRYQSWSPGISVVGDLIGFPSMLRDAPRSGADAVRAMFGDEGAGLAAEPFERAVAAI